MSIRISYFQTEFVPLLALAGNRLFGRHNQLPSHLNQYRLVQPFLVDHSANFLSGLYEYQGQQFFVKVWVGSWPDLNYHNLQNEKLSVIALTKNPNLSSASIKIPQLIATVKDAHLLALIYEWVNGKTLNNFSPFKQQTALAQINRWLAALPYSSGFKLIDRNYLRQSLVVSTILLIFLDPLSLKSIVKIARESWHDLSQQPSNQLYFVHGDLTPDNILVAGSNLYVTDWENAHFTTVPPASLNRYSLLRLASLTLDKESRQKILGTL